MIQPLSYRRECLYRTSTLTGTTFIEGVIYYAPDFSFKYHVFLIENGIEQKKGVLQSLFGRRAYFTKVFKRRSTGRSVLMNKAEGDRYELYSSVLEQKAVITDYGAGIMEMQTQDGVHYTPPEMILLFKEGRTYDKRVHLIKKIFGGKIVSVEENRTKEEWPRWQAYKE